MYSRALPVFFVLPVIFFATSCSQEKPEPEYRVIGEAYAGPNRLPLRQDLSLRSPVVSTIAHAEKVEVLERRRRFVQVRTKDQKIGWVDMRLLISAKQRQQIEEMAAAHKAAPSMGRASVFDPLNVHIEPNRFSPTFLQIEEKEKVEIIGHRVVERKPYSGETLDLADASEPQAKLPKKRRPRKDPPIPPPPAPDAPKPPENWLELSRTPVVEAPAPAVPAPGKKGRRAQALPYSGPPMDDMTLIRTGGGKVGWVLSNALFLEVPDEVAQYAEGKRITSYFAVGETMSESGMKNHWLWTTQSQKYAPFEFDGLRVFTFNARRNRYETAHRERDVKGFFPVVVERAAGGTRFAIVVEEAAGALWKRSYIFDGTRVRLLEKTPYAPPKSTTSVGGRGTPPPPPAPSLLERAKGLWPL